MRNGWQTGTLGEVCEIVNGGTPKTGVAEYWGDAHLWITPAEMGKRVNPYVHETERKITDLGLQNSSATILPPNSVILSSRAPIGHLVINTEPMATNQGCKGLVPGGHLQSKFLYYYLTSIVDFLNSLGTGATFKELSGSKLKEVQISFPLPAEQRRIVGILDKAFDGIATAKTNAEKNLQNARALFESHLDAVFSQCGDGWTSCRLAECLDLITYGFTNPMPTAQTGPYMVTARNVVDGGIDYIGARRTSQEAFVKLLTDKSRPRAGDVLLTKDGTLGRLAVVERADLCINQSVALLRPNDRMDPHFMRHLLSSRTYQHRMVADADGATIKHIYITRVDKMDVAFPPTVIDQQRIVGKIEEVKTVTRRLESTYQQKLAALEDLKKSLLHGAFSGRL